MRIESFDLLRLQQSPKRWPFALQAGIAIAVPIIVASLFGRSSLGTLASLGTFTALYLTAVPIRTRLLLLPLVGGGFVSAAALGVLTVPTPALHLATLVAVACAAAWATQLSGLGPPGAMMFALVFGAAGHIVEPVALGGAGVPAALVVACVAGGAVWSWCVVAAPFALPSVRARDRANRAAPHQPARPRFSVDGARLRVASAMSLAAIIGGIVASILQSAHGYWVVCSALAVLTAGQSIRITANRAMHRVLGTVVGLLLFLALRWWGPEGVTLGVVLGVLQYTVEVLIVRHYALALSFITPLALTIATAQHVAEAGAVAVERLWQTMIGAAIAVAAAVGIGRAFELAAARRQE